MCQQRASDPYAGMKSFISYFPQSCHYPYLLALAFPCMLRDIALKYSQRKKGLATKQQCVLRQMPRS